MSAPVALLAFNRPAETARVLEAIGAARPETLFVVADGPRADRPGEADLVEQVRTVIDRGITWPCRVERLYADENLGCGARIRSGLDWVFEQVPEAIVLEDDCLAHPSFFPFTNAMLERYRDDERVHMIAAMNYFGDATRPESYFFTRYCAIWGWASWARAWHHDRAMRDWPAARDAGFLEETFGHAGLAEWLRELFDQAYEGRVDTWDIQWFWSALAQRRLTLTPKVNLVSNIGYAGTHGAGGRNLGMPTEDIHAEALVHPSAMEPDVDYERRLHREWLVAPPPSARERLLRTTGRVLSPFARRRARSRGA